MARRDGGKPRRPTARHEQQPGADGPSSARKPEVRAEEGRRERIDPVSGRVGDSPCIAHLPSTLRVSVSNVPLCGASGSSVVPGMRVVPSASLRPGPVGCGAPAPLAAAAQILFCVSRACCWFAFLVVAAWGGMPHDCELSTRNLTIFAIAPE